MNKLFFTKCIPVSLLILLLSSCMQQEVYQGGKNKSINPADVFDFNLTKEVKLNIDYGFANNYYIIFDLYDQNPLIEQGSSLVKDEAITPLFSDFTDTKGKFSGSVTIPSGLTEVWLYSNYPGVVSPVKLTVSDTNEISFNQSSYITSLQTKTRSGVTSNGYKYIGDIMPGVTWNASGFPSNVEKELNLPPADILYSINATYNGAKENFISQKHPEWLDNNRSSEIKITKDTEISIVYINSGASWKNTVGYFTYPTGTIPTENTIKKIIAFPNITPISRSGSMICGHEIKLKYWNNEKQQFENKFPKGVNIGWYLEGNSFNNGNIEKVSYATTRYSYNSLNPKDSQPRVVALRHSTTDQLVAIGFEDSEDFNYTDAIFYTRIAEPGAISSDLPALPVVDPPTNATSTEIGTLTFEDQWPSQSDYDMNDVVIEYTCIRHKNVVSGKIFKIVDEFVPIHNGGSNICGFGYQLSKLDPNRIKKIEVSGTDNWELETGHQSPTIILFNNVRNFLNKKIVVSIELTDVTEQEVKVQYNNPFIFVEDRSREVHLVNFPPTNRADMELFNTKNDVSNVGEGVYYIAYYKNKDVTQMPFAINLPIHNFNIPPEKLKIYDSFPKFIDWVKSKGTSSKNWYK